MTINCLGKLVSLNSPKILGILNITPDSFYDGGVLKSEKEVISKTALMLEEGADFIDIGGYSSRPGATNISPDEEKKRVIPIIKLLREEFPNILLSVDTFRAAVAKEALDCGVCMVNDISAGTMDATMMKVIAPYQVPYIMMHMKGTPQNMQSFSQYENITTEINCYFSEKKAEARALGINDIIIDAGFGFSKTTAHNFELLNHLDLLQQLEVPVLTGISRKSMIYKTLGTNPQNALNGTTALHMVALQKGSNILRVHDVKAAKECILLHEALQIHQNS